MLPSIKKKALLIIGLLACIFTSLYSLWTINMGDLSTAYIDLSSGQYMGDPLAGHLHAPNYNREIEWEEHPGGKFLLHTNNLGFRNDADILVNKPPGSIRILVTGDSHTDGVLNNKENVCSVLEKLLNQSDSGRFEALNGGVGFYGPQNYLGFIKKFLYLDPDLIIVIFYAGNDFLDAIHIATERKELKSMIRPENYYDKLWQLDEILPGFSGQCLNQAWYFYNYPNRKQISIKITLRNILQIHSLCTENNIPFIFLLLPSEIGACFASDSSRIMQAASYLGLSDEELNVENELADQLLLQLKQTGISTLDLRTAFHQSRLPLYWKRDLHINISAHRLIADCIFRSGLIQNSIRY